MKIGINALGLKPASHGGVEIYFRNLISNLNHYGEGNEFYIFLNSKKLKKQIKPFINSRVKLIYFPQRNTYIASLLFLLFNYPTIFIKLLLNKFSRSLLSKNIFEVDTSLAYTGIINFDCYEIDVIHFPFHTIPTPFFDLNLPIVLTIHDIQQEYYPEFFDVTELAKRRKHYKPSAERADFIIAISRTTKQTVVEKYGINAEKVIVSYQGCSKNFAMIGDTRILSIVRNKYALPNEYIFYPASTWPHKNHLKLIDALRILKDKYSFRTKLVLTGIPMNNHNNIMDAVKRLNLINHVSFLNFVPFDDLPAIYNMATIMTFPSLFEGFGIPLLEAMSVGLPIACSDRTSIPELVGDAGIYFNPDNAEDIAVKIYQLWNDNALKKKLVKKGFERAKQFTWEEATRKTIMAYKRASACFNYQTVNDK